MFGRRQSDHEHQHHPVKAAKTAGPDFDIRYALSVVLKRWKPILGVVLLAGLMAALYLSFQKPLYTATAMIQLNTNQRPLVDTESLILGHLDDSAVVQSELDILTAPALIRRVVETLKLQEKPEFNSDLQPKTFVWNVRHAIGNLMKNFRQPAAGADDNQDEETLIQVTAAVTKHLSLYKNPLSYTVNISFTSLSPERAKNIANTIADEYLSYQIEAGNDTNRHAREWYDKRIAELRQNLIASETAVQEFSEQNNLFELDGKTLDDEQVGQLNTQLAQAKASEAQDEARLARATELVKSPGGAESVGEVLSSVLIQSLRGKEADLIRERSELSGHYGPIHPKIEQINTEITDLRSKINVEIQKILAGMENEVMIDKGRVVSLTADLDSMRKVLGDKTRVQLTELKRQSDANRTIYESFLSKAKETGEAENIDQATAKIISPASTPMLPSWPKKTQIIALFLLAGFFAGTAMAFLLELLNVGFTSREQLEEYLGIVTLGMVPEISGEEADMHYAIRRPASVYSEALRTIIAALHFSDKKNPPPKSLLITSSLPQEGKGWLAISLARIAAQAGKKVLLLDCDLHRPMVSDTFAGKPNETLNGYLTGTCTLESIFNVDEATGMHYIASSPYRGSVQELLESDRMKNLMTAAKAAYDIVIIDSPPVIGMSDVLFISSLADTVVLAVRWASTPRRIVGNALRILTRAHIKVAGATLTRVSMDQYKKSEFGSSYYYSYYNNYYHDEAPAAPSLADNLKDKIVKFSAK